ncbi:MAG: hypothetical protein QNI86_02310 [Halieaceae bacterium]|nr:hypothetical protein [Halieaceae bacterium]
MKLLLESTDRIMLLEKAALLRARGIPVHLEEVAHVGAIPCHLYVVFDRHLDDARSLLVDCSHPVAQPVFDEEWEGIAAEVREYKLSLGNSLLENLFLALVVIMGVGYVASRTFD